MSRPSREKTFMDVASVFARRSTCSRAQVGAVIVKDNHILAHGYNGTPPGLPHCVHQDDEPCEQAIHAEANAIAYAARVGVNVAGGTLYTTHEPCLRCAQLIIAAGITKVVFDQHYRQHVGLHLLWHASVKTQHGV